MLQSAAAIMAFALLLFPATGMQDNTGLVGCDSRAVDREVYRDTLKIIDFRLSVGSEVEALLLLSPYSDPDVLGLIAADRGQPLAVREVAANAILDQLYIAEAYFQTCAQHYLKILSRDSQPALRLKGNIGLAALEYWSYLAGPGTLSPPPQLLRLQLAAERERDSRVKSILEQVASGEAAELAGFALREEASGREVPYKLLDSIPRQSGSETTPSDGELATFWERYQASIELNAELDIQEEAGDSQVMSEAVNEVLKDLQGADASFLQGAMARFNATLSTQPLDRPYPAQVLTVFRQIAKEDRDPYSRALALAPVCVGPKSEAVEFLLDRLASDQAPLVRLSAAYQLRLFCEDTGTRQRLIAQFRLEEDPRIKLCMLHSLVWPYSELPPPEVLAFMLGRVRDQQDPDILEFVVVVLGNARVRNAVEPLSNLAHTTRDPILRERIAEAMRRIRGG